MESLKELHIKNIPCLFYIGDHDFNYGLVSGHVEHLQNAEKLILEGFDHVDGFLRIDTVIQPIREFLKRTS